MIRTNHYEAAFAAMLRARGVPTIPVNEDRRVPLGEGTVKNLDFLLAPAGGRPLLLIDVKGRRLGTGRGRLERWVTRDDLAGLLAWQRHVSGGNQAVAAFAFVYLLPSEGAENRFAETFVHRRRRYGCWFVPAKGYEQHVTRRSAKWQTVEVPAAAFAALARPPAALLGPAPTMVADDAAPPAVSGERAVRGAVAGRAG